MAGISTVEKIYELLKKAGNVEAQELIMKLREELVELREQNSTLKDEVGDLKRPAQLKEDLVYEAPYYWRAPTDGTRDGPFCQLCFDKNQALIRLQKQPLAGAWSCHSCEKCVTDKDYAEPASNVVLRGATW